MTIHKALLDWIDETVWRGPAATPVELVLLGMMQLAVIARTRRLVGSLRRIHRAVVGGILQCGVRLQPAGRPVGQHIRGIAPTDPEEDRYVILDDACGPTQWYPLLPESAIVGKVISHEDIGC